MKPGDMVTLHSSGFGSVIYEWWGPRFACDNKTSPISRFADGDIGILLETNSGNGCKVMAGNGTIGWVHKLQVNST